MSVRIVIGLAAFAALGGFPPGAQAQTPPPADVTANAKLEADFTAFDPDYAGKRAARIVELRALSDAVLGRERRGEATACSHQILFEAGSLLLATADFKTIDARLSELRETLAHPDREKRADHAGVDGLWGACNDAWYLKLYDTYDRLEKAAPDEPAPHALPKFLDSVATPDALSARLLTLATSDVRATGVDHEREYNDTLATLLQMIVRGRPENYTVDPALKQRMLELVTGELRNPETGWWGERYVRDGKTEYVDDLSITFHVVSYLKGRVPDMPRVIDTALALRSLDYPAGWLWKGEYWNHNNMDVITVFQLGWSQAGAAQREATAAEIQRMLDWCLTQSLQPDGSFKPRLPDLSTEDAEYYGVEFLVRVGYFDRSKRFWTARDYPEAPAVKAQILGYLRAHAATGGAGGDAYKGAMADLMREP